jgi:hypothetical protein
LRGGKSTLNELMLCMGYVMELMEDKFIQTLAEQFQTPAARE